MVKHVILWKIDEKYSPSEKNEIRNGAKAQLESLVGQIDGLIELEVRILPLESSNADMMLDSLFADSDALRGYAHHPAHNAVADKYVRPFTSQRLCIDYEI